jgi:hypothetical protein
MSEKLIEKKLREEVSELGGLALKFASPYFTGMPDRIVLMPGARVYFPELKSKGKKQSSRQKFVKKQLEQMGFDVDVIDDDCDLSKFIKRIKR